MSFLLLILCIAFPFLFSLSSLFSSPPPPPQHSHSSHKVSFLNHSLLRLFPYNSTHLSLLEAALENDLTLDLWSSLRLSHVDLRVPPRSYPSFTHSLNNAGIPFEILSENIQTLIDQSQIKHQTPKLLQEGEREFYTGLPLPFSRNVTFTTPSEPPPVGIASTWIQHSHRPPPHQEPDRFFSAYHDYDSIANFTRSLATLYPSLVTPIVLGKTYEGRSIVGIRITGLSKTRKKGFVLHAGQHGREWIAPAVVLFIARNLLTQYGREKVATRIIDSMELTFVPVLNVDGYVYTHTTNRMWRKTREATPIPWCFGVDSNRNWGYKWSNGGGSTSPCSEAYIGPQPFSSPETLAMSQYILGRGNVAAYVDFHSYSQLWLSPFAGDCGEVPRDNEDILECALGTVKALHKVYKTKFITGGLCNMIYKSAGASIDWTYAVAGVKYSYSVELRDKGKYGFLLPPSEIVSSGLEAYEGIRFMARFVLNREASRGN